MKTKPILIYTTKTKSTKSIEVLKTEPEDFNKSKKFDNLWEELKKKINEKK